MPNRFDPCDPPGALYSSEAHPPDGFAHLQVVRGRTRYRLRPVATPAFLIGTAADCDLVLSDARFPEVYACLVTRGAEISIRHLGFSPGMLINGRAVGYWALRHGDRIEAGPYEFRLLLGPPEGGGTELTPRLLHQGSLNARTLELNQLEAWLPSATNAPPISDLASDLRRLATAG